MAVAEVFDDLNFRQEERDKENSAPQLVSEYASSEVLKSIPSTIARWRSIARALSNRVIEGYAFEEQLKKALRRPFSALNTIWLYWMLRIAEQPVNIEDQGATGHSQDIGHSQDAESWTLVCRRGKSNERTNKGANAHSMENT